jgi:hypothetical protein
MFLRCCCWCWCCCRCSCCKRYDLNCLHSVEDKRDAEGKEEQYNSNCHCSKEMEKYFCSQFHQHFTCKFFVRKHFMHLFSSCVLAMKLKKSCAKHFCAINLHVKCWWNWHLLAFYGYEAVKEFHFVFFPETVWNS